MSPSGHTLELMCTVSTNETTPYIPLSIWSQRVFLRGIRRAGGGERRRKKEEKERKERGTGKREKEKEEKEGRERRRRKRKEQEQRERWRWETRSNCRNSDRKRQSSYLPEKVSEGEGGGSS